ncbi:MAG: ATP-binding cassette domain-containing protein [Amylibacter sp.]|nr:ATP-binding cassette domain-containing protein [Amylibacter sp.]
MSGLKLTNLSYSVDGTELLHDISFTQASVGISAILGPNGAGKSLLLSLIHGVIKPNMGRVTWDGILADKTKLSRGFVFQTPIVLRRSVRANLAYPLKINGQHSETAIKAMLELSHLTPLAKQPAASLSGGEAQRMAIARALITKPEVLLLDEPCSNLDPASTKLIEAMIGQFVAKGGSVFISTHDLAQAKRLADTVLFINAGQLLEHTAARDFFDGPETPQAQAYLNGDL